jgi:hypothetical protein
MVEGVERLTLDMTAIRDIVFADRPRHADALQLLARAAAHDVELALPPQGRRADLEGNFEGDLAARMEDLLTKAGVIELPQLAWPSDVTFPSEDLFPGYVVEGFGRYVESHIADGRDLLITGDGGLLTICGRLDREHGLAVQAQRLADYVAELD